MLNHVTLLGRLAQVPELRHTPNGKPVTSFDLAVQGYNKDAPPEYIPIVCWNETANFVDRFLGKGRQIVVEGRITARKHTDKEGNNRKAIEVVASRIYFADSNNGNRGADNGDNYQSEGFEEVVDDDGDLPF